MFVNDNRLLNVCDTFENDFHINFESKYNVCF